MMTIHSKKETYKDILTVVVVNKVDYYKNYRVKSVVIILDLDKHNVTTWLFLSFSFQSTD